MERDENCDCACCQVERFLLASKNKGLDADMALTVLLTAFGRVYMPDGLEPQEKSTLH